MLHEHDTNPTIRNEHDQAEHKPINFVRFSIVSKFVTLIESADSWTYISINATKAIFKNPKYKNYQIKQQFIFNQ